MWTNTVNECIFSGYPDTLTERYPKIFERRLYRSPATHAIRMPDDYIVPDAVHIEVRTPIDAMEHYISSLTLPWILNGKRVVFLNMSSITRTLFEDATYYMSGTYDYIILTYNNACYAMDISNASYRHAGLSNLLNQPVYLDETNRIIATKFSNQIVHKLIAVTDNLLDKSNITYPYDAKIMTNLFNFKIDKWLIGMCQWFDTFYDALKESYEDRMFEKLMQTLATAKLKELEIALSDLRSSIADKEDSLRQLYNNLQHLNDSYNGMCNRIGDRNSVDSIMKIFKRCTNLKDIKSWNSDSVCLHFNAPLLNYDMDTALRWCTEENNVFFTEEVQDLMYKLLVDGKYTIIFDCYIVWDIIHNSVCANSNGGIETDLIPQPHIVFYNCFGNNKSEIVKALVDSNYELALDCTNAAASSYNLGDGAVTRKFIEYIKNHTDHKVFNNETQTFVTIQEVIDDDTIVRP